ncbi:MAG: DUF4421 family protein [Bdellovibrionales bacterium]
MRYLVCVLVVFWVRLGDAAELSLGLGSFTPSLNLDISSPDGVFESILYQPNQGSLTAFMISYGNIGFGLSTKNGVTEDAQSIPLDTEFEDFQFSILGESSNFLISYQEYTGYYVSNSTDIDSAYTEFDSESSISDLSTQSVSFRYIYIFDSSSLSLNAAYGIGEKTNKSGGSWLLGLGLASEKLSSPTQGFAPSYAPSQYDDLKNLRSFKSVSYSIDGGYSYTYVYDQNLFMNGLIMLSAGAQSRESETTSFTTSGNSFSGGGVIGISFGWNSEKHKLNLQFVTQSRNAQFESHTISTSIQNVGFIYAYRIGNASIPILEDISNWFD